MADRSTRSIADSIFRNSVGNRVDPHGETARLTVFGPAKDGGRILQQHDGQGFGEAERWELESPDTIWNMDPEA
jgi:hypothetical protein